MTAWLLPGEVLDSETYWPGCTLDTASLWHLLSVAQEQCEAFAPALGPTDVPPESWRLAVAMQARALHNAGIAGAGDQVGADGLTVQVFPMDWNVKALLRPRVGKPRVR